MADIVCNDNRFEVIGRAKEHLLEATNIDTSPDEMKVLDSFLFRCWQMGWLDRYEDTADAIMPMTLENAIDFLDKIGWLAEHDRIMSTPQWIPCEERLPEKDQRVLCQCRAGIIDVLRLKPNGFWENPNPYVNYMPGFVIAWMPLPEPYKGGGGEMNKDGLKPCPFCGGKPRRMMWSDFYALGTHDSGAMTAFTVICSDCHARVDAVMGSANHPYEVTKIDDWDTAESLMEEAAERWNARARGEKEE